MQVLVLGNPSPQTGPRRRSHCLQLSRDDSMHHFKQTYSPNFGESWPLSRTQLSESQKSVRIGKIESKKDA